MVEEGTQKVDKEPGVREKEAEENEEEVARNDFAEEKGVIPPPEHKTAPPVKENPTAEKSLGGFVDRDAVLAKVANEKRLALIKAWEESEKTKAENKAYKKLSAVESWENSSKASVDAQLKKIEEKFEKKKAKYGEKMKNKLAAIHRAAEEKRATVEAKRWEELIKVEDTATKFRTAGYVPRNLLGCFSY
ncbi:remorin-like isoform X2 [Juglans microcarpa x Juglans regia]|uniref:remorin-like isoform X2 n=1 Tax=Juglans microcarpa x Juglans regia TaxID=2249226 RepID=UPI001B7DF02F|nr:remorin-like isoform X2 [Juglans microcarpa x Juglans regia]